MMRANMQLTDYDAEGRPRTDDLVKFEAPLSLVVTQELDGAAAALGLARDEILVAALGRALQRTIGDGTAAVDIHGYDTCVNSVAVRCAAPGDLSADQMLASVHAALAGLAIHHIVHGVPADSRSQPLAEVLFSYGEAAITGGHFGHVLELRAYPTGDTLALDWWFDGRSFEPYTVQELAEQFPLAIIELTSEATPAVRTTAELVMAH